MNYLLTCCLTLVVTCLYILKGHLPSEFSTVIYNLMYINCLYISIKSVMIIGANIVIHVTPPCEDLDHTIYNYKKFNIRCKISTCLNCIEYLLIIFFVNHIVVVTFCSFCLICMAMISHKLNNYPLKD